MYNLQGNNNICLHFFSFHVEEFFSEYR